MVVVGLGVAGTLHLVSRLLGGRLPKWVISSGAGLAMIAFAIWSEYSWYPRFRATLPETMHIVSAPAETAFYRPWSYLYPVTHRFIVVDLGAAVHAETAPERFVAPVSIVARWSPIQQVQVAFDCAGGRRADLFRGGKMGSDGEVTGVDWVTPGPGDELLSAACNGG